MKPAVVVQVPEDDGGGVYGAGVAGWRMTMYWGHRSADFGHYEMICEDSDCRDAELMLAIMRYAACWNFSSPGCIKYGAHLAMLLHQHFSGGDLGEAFNITRGIELP